MENHQTYFEQYDMDLQKWGKFDVRQCTSSHAILLFDSNVSVSCILIHFTDLGARVG